MVRKVSGFLAHDGHYFDTKDEAANYEAVQKFNKALVDHLMELGLTGAYLDFMLDKTRYFVLTNRDVVRDYITRIKSIPVMDEPDIRDTVTAPVALPPPEEISDDDREFSEILSSLPT